MCPWHRAALTIIAATIATVTVMIRIGQNIHVRTNETNIVLSHAPSLRLPR
jgi:hypothetical protein